MNKNLLTKKLMLSVAVYFATLILSLVFYYIFYKTDKIGVYLIFSIELILCIFMTLNFLYFVNILRVSRQRLAIIGKVIGYLLAVLQFISIAILVYLIYFISALFALA